jgi:hypothetical protein
MSQVAANDFKFSSKHFWNDSFIHEKVLFDFVVSDAGTSARSHARIATQSLRWRLL